MEIDEIDLTRDALTALRQLVETWGEVHSLGLSCHQAAEVTPDDEVMYSWLVGRARHFYDRVSYSVRAPYVRYGGSSESAFEFVLSRPSLTSIVSPGSAIFDVWRDACKEATAAIWQAIGALEAELGEASKPGSRREGSGGPARAEPHNGGLPAEETSTEYFVAHEFTPEKTDDLRRAIDEALAGSGFTPYYADNEVKEGHIFTNKILPKIRATRFGIYDLSNPEKANVFMELGAAIAMRRPYFVICERGTKLPSDVLGLDRIEYDSYVHLAHELKAKVADALRATP